MHISSGDAAGQFSPASPTCPADAFTFGCTVFGNMSGITTWRVGTECVLVHRSTPSSLCGLDNAFKARSGTGFGTSATSFSSTLSGTGDSTLNGTLVECFGPANSVDPGNLVGNSTLKILGQFKSPH